MMVDPIYIRNFSLLVAVAGALEVTKNN